MIFSEYSDILEHSICRHKDKEKKSSSHLWVERVGEKK